MKSYMFRCSSELLFAKTLANNCKKFCDSIQNTSNSNTLLTDLPAKFCIAKHNWRIQYFLNGYELSLLNTSISILYSKDKEFYKEYLHTQYSPINKYISFKLNRNYPL